MIFWGLILDTQISLLSFVGGRGAIYFIVFCWLIENGRIILIMTSDLMEGYKDTHSTGMKNVVGTTCSECHCLSFVWVLVECCVLP